MIENHLSNILKNMNLYTCRETTHCFCFNWWADLYKPKSSFITELIEECYNSTTYKRKCHLFSVFGNRYNIEKQTNKQKYFKIFITTENIYSPKYDSFSDGMCDYVDLSLTMSESLSKLHDNHIRFPVGWLDKLIKHDSEEKEIHEIINQINKPRKFKNNEICLITKKDEFDTKGRIVNLLNKNGIYVTCAGLFLNNTDILFKRFSNNKYECLENFGFNLCPENTNNSGYCSEKLLDAFKCGCIPIYYGCDGNPELNIFNQNAIIFYSPDNEEKFLHTVETAISNKNGYRDFLLNEPIFKEDASERIYQNVLSVKNFIKKLMF